VSDLKYSIILPVYNGLPYLETAVASVLASNRNDFELLVSDDHSTDGSIQYLESIQDSRLRLLRTPARMSMAEHWEWVLSHSKGSWGMFLGQDDALQGYFFDHADTLTAEAAKRSLRVIAARRSYIFWPGCEADFPQRAQYFALNRTYVRRTRMDCFSSLFLGKKYHELPQMYTNSLFHMSLIEEAKTLQGGKVFTCHPQDANLAALAILFEKTYLRSEIPLGWVGTSPSSAGLAIAKADAEIKTIGDDLASQTKLAESYSNSIISSHILYPKFAGEFKLANEAIYLWQALVVVSEKLFPELFRLLKGKPAVRLLLSSVLAENELVWARGPRWFAFLELIRINRMSLIVVRFVSFPIRALFALRKIAMSILRFGVEKGPAQLAGVGGFSISTDESSKIDLQFLNRKTQLLFEALEASK